VFDRRIRRLQVMSELNIMIVAVAAIVAISMMAFALSGFDPSAIICWLELVCHS
jgi:hypothetical protein